MKFSLTIKPAKSSIHVIILYKLTVFSDHHCKLCATKLWRTGNYVKDMQKLPLPTRASSASITSSTDIGTEKERTFKG